MKGNRPNNAVESYYRDFLYGADGRFSPNASMNRQTLMERMYSRILGELATNRFKWTGFPESVDTRFLEMQLFYSALCVFYWDDRVDKYLALQAAPAGVINHSQNPTAFLVTGANFLNRTVSATKSAGKISGVPIWANYFRSPDLDIINVYAPKLANIDMTIEVNMRNARRSRIAGVDENTQLSVQALTDAIDRGDPVIKLMTGTTDISKAIAALDLGVDPKSIETLSVVRQRIWSEAMTMLGIDNANQDKTERLVAGEAEANEEQVSSMKWVNLNARRQGAHDIGQMFGLPITVDYNTELNISIPESLVTPMSEAELIA